MPAHWRSFVAGLLSTLALGLAGVVHAQTPCGSDGQRACCFAEARFGPCMPGNSEVPMPNSGRCGGLNPFGIQSSGVCVADTPCGGDGERACCSSEAAFGACRPGLAEVPMARSGQCSRSLPGIQSSGVCVAVTACGGEGQRACCAGERSFGACQAGLSETPRANSGQCGNAAPGIQSNGFCAGTPCGGEREFACTAEQAPAACNPPFVERGGICVFPDNSVPRRDDVGFPVRGSVKWSVLLCRYKGQAVDAAKTPAYYQRLLQLSGSNGVVDYLHEVSRGLFSQQMSIQGWFVVDLPFAQRQNEAQLDDCMDAARSAGFVPPPEHLVMVLPPSDMGARPDIGSRVLVPPVLDGLLHEMFHVYGLMDNQSHVVFDYGNPQVNPLDPRPVSYGDPFDILSWGFSRPGNPSAFGGTDGPRLNGFSLDRLGWLGAGETATFGAGGETSSTYVLTPLYAPGPGGTRIVRVPFDAADPRHYYQVELRDARGRDIGFGAPKVLIYEVKRHANGRLSAASTGAPHGYLLLDAPGGTPIQSLAANGVSINVDRIAADGSSAEVTVRSPFARRCLPGSVWRVAGPDDLVCVDGDARNRVAAENQLATARREPGGGAFGPDTCRQGYVWRDAFPGDHACVDGTARAAAAAENQGAPERTNPARLTVGPSMCKDGFVWRLIDAFDYVCVPAANRDEAQADNQSNATRRLSKGRGNCREGFVERKAFAGDKVCATPQAALKARLDSSMAWSRNFGRQR